MNEQYHVECTGKMCLHNFPLYLSTSRYVIMRPKLKNEEDKRTANTVDLYRRQNKLAMHWRENEQIMEPNDSPKSLKKKES